MPTDTPAVAPSRAMLTPPVRAALATAFVVLAVLGVLEGRLRALRHVTITQRASDEATLPSPAAIRVMALGHREWAADVLWVSALGYFGETLVTHQQQRFLQRYAETIEAVNPRFRQAYFWGALVSIYNARTIRPESVWNAIHHLERGLREFPDDGEMYYQLGHDYFQELASLLGSAPAEQAEARRRGAEYLRRASGLGYGAAWLSVAAGGALQRAGLEAEAAEYYRGLYLRTDDEQMRTRIAEHIADLARSRGVADPFLEAMRGFDAERREAYPYVAPTLYFFVGPAVPGIRRMAVPAATANAPTPAREADAAVP